MGRRSKTRVAKEPAPGAGKRLLLILAVGVFAVTVAAYAPSFGNGFVNWDDEANFVSNQAYRGLFPSHLAWMFTTFHMGHYQPLAWVTLGADYSVHGMDAGGYHLTSALLHGLNATLLMLLLLSLLELVFPAADRTRLLVCCALGALFWAVHPLRVESVAWATERRDIVSGIFYILALRAYLRRETRAAALLFVLSLFGKAWAITLPAVFVVLDLYPLRRDKPVARLVAEKWPYFAAGLGFTVVAYVAQASAGAARAVTEHPWPQRIAQAFYGLVFYPLKTVWPFDLSPLYIIQPKFNPFELQYVAAAVAVIGITTFLMLRARRYGWAAATWVAYAAIVSPVLGLAQSGPQLAADRYTYLAALPFSALLAGALVFVLQKKGKGTWGALAGATALAIAFFATLTAEQTRVWRDSETLWSHALSLDERNYYAYNNRGKIRQDAGDVDGSTADYARSLSINPTLAEPNYNYANLLQHRGQFAEAMKHYDAAVSLAPERGVIVFQRGVVKRKAGEPAGSLEDLDRALQLEPREARYYNERAVTLIQLGQMERALADCTRAIELDAGLMLAHLNRGTLLLQAGNGAAAVQDFERALEIAPAAWPGRPRAEEVLQQARAAAGRNPASISE